MIRLIGRALLLVMAVAGLARAADAPPAYDKKCKMCHSVGGQGGPMAKMGGALDGVGAKHDADWLRAFLADPKSKIEKAKMPKVALAADELEAIVNYLMTLK